VLSFRTLLGFLTRALELQHSLHPLTERIEKMSEEEKIYKINEIELIYLLCQYHLRGEILGICADQREPQTKDERDEELVLSCHEELGGFSIRDDGTLLICEDN